MDDQLPDETIPLPSIGGARDMLREVNSLASAALTITRQDVLPDDTSEDLQGRIRLLAFLIDRMGWVADVGLRHLGEQGAFERAEDWMLPSA